MEYKDEYQITEAEANKSLTGNSQEIMRIVNSVLPDNPRVVAFMRNAAMTCEELKDVENNFTMFSKEELEAFLKRYEKCNEAIAREYLGQDVHDGQGLEIDEGAWEILPVFRFLEKYGKVAHREMFNIFNMGIGMVIALDASEADKANTTANFEMPKGNVTVTFSLD